ncbi:GNAT family N-acetyltransferase [Paenibacillus sp. JX-17]|uniref:GNAT family N-acetyltransferase n=1 Tax=Paenibacillus lacisoli TaxID=3064525 RepID=A0ABT9CG08_9BACL|nr:GNAT family N-acetyltransferase [Paenibacillus sp. JX-17]MDO7907508.1 GNAT family N-acetyltransferase [Paenibacillus sp. JX-17]
MEVCQIRMAEDKDIPFLWEMLYQSMYIPEGEAPFSREILKDPMIAKYMKDWGRKGDLGLVAEQKEGQVVGAITSRYFTEQQQGFGFVAEDIPEMGMALLPEYRGQGIGKALMSRLLEELRRQGVKQVSLSVDPNNIPAVSLYQRFGFRRVGWMSTSITMLADV